MDGPSDPSARPWLAHYPPGVPADIENPAASDPGAHPWVRGALARSNGARVLRRPLVVPSDVDRGRRFAAALQRDGFRSGDRLAIYLPNCPMYPIAYLGALRLGLTVVQVSPLYLGQDLSGLLKDAAPKGIVTLEIPLSEPREDRGRVPAPPDLSGAAPRVLSGVQAAVRQSGPEATWDVDPGPDLLERSPLAYGGTDRGGRDGPCGGPRAGRRGAPVYRGHHGYPQGGDAHAPQSGGERVAMPGLVPHGPAGEGDRPRRGAALPRVRPDRRHELSAHRGEHRGPHAAAGRG